MPECRAQYLLNIALRLGPAKSSGFGLQPISPVDIKAYCDMFKEDLSIWEVEQVLEMAKVFVGAHAEYDGNNCTSPVAVADEGQAAEVSQKLFQMFVKRSQSNKHSEPIGGRQDE